MVYVLLTEFALVTILVKYAPPFIIFFINNSTPIVFFQGIISPSFIYIPKRGVFWTTFFHFFAKNHKFRIIKQNRGISEAQFVYFDKRKIVKIPRNNKIYVAAENSRENFGQIKSAIIKITALVNVLKFFRAISSKPVV